MSDDEADPELLELLRQSLGITKTREGEISSETGVLKNAEYIYNNAIDVSIDMYSTKAAAASIHAAMQERAYSAGAWSEQSLHPKPSEGFSDVDIVNFVFTMDLLNFSFWSELSESKRYQVDYQGKRWTGYQSLVASLRRALDEDTPVTTPSFWRSPGVSDETLEHVFRSATDEMMPLINERIAILREAANVLHESFDYPDEPVQADALDGDKPQHSESASNVDAAMKETFATTNAEDTPAAAEPQNQTLSSAEQVSQEATEEAKDAETTLKDAPADVPEFREESAVPQSESPKDVLVAPEKQNETSPSRAQRGQPDLSIVRLIEKADRSAGKLVNLLAKHFPCFRDETRFDGRKVRVLKRAQIFVADLWAAFNGTGYGEFHDIDALTMFADYRVPQMLHSIGVISYSPPLHYCINDLKTIASGHSWEVQLRGCSIWAVELIRREILREHPDAEVNAVLIDFFLYDLAKEKEKLRGGLAMPHHRTRSIWY